MLQYSIPDGLIVQDERLDFAINFSVMGLVFHEESVSEGIKYLLHDLQRMVGVNSTSVEVKLEKALIKLCLLLGLACPFAEVELKVVLSTSVS